jgi:hypothetical protein
VTVASAPRTGRRVAAAPNAGGPNAPVISQYTARWFWERDLVNLAKSGRQWLGEGFNAGVPQSFDTDLTDLVVGAPVQITASLAGTSYSSQSFVIAANSASVTQNLANYTPARLPGVCCYQPTNIYRNPRGLLLGLTPRFNLFQYGRLRQGVPGLSGSECPAGPYG